MSLNAKQNHSQTQLNLQKLLLYVSVTDDDLPTITLTPQQSPTVATELRMYFNDEQLLIKHVDFYGDNYLASQEFQKSIADILEQFGYEVREKDTEWGFLEFLEYWVNAVERLRVDYEVFDQIFKNGVENYLENLARIVGKNSVENEKKSKQNVIIKGKKGVFEDSKNKQNQDNSDCMSKSSASKTSIRQTLPMNLPPDLQPTDPFNYYLQKFFIHYSKKSTPSIKTPEFQKLQHFYTTLNLTKFMSYCKQVGLLKAHKSITVKYIQQLFVKNQDERHVVEYEGFMKMVREVLVKIVGESKIESQGYELIGVGNRIGFVEKMRQVGVIVPLKKVIFAKPKKTKELAAEYGEQIKKQQQAQGKRLKEQKQNSSTTHLIVKNGGYQQAYQSAWQKIHCTPAQPSFLPHLLPHSPSNSKLAAHLQELLELDDQQDPYLKRFKGANNKQNHEEIDERSGVIGRMQKRMDNVVKRVR